MVCDGWPAGNGQHASSEGEDGEDGEEDEEDEDDEDDDKDEEDEEDKEDEVDEAGEVGKNVPIRTNLSVASRKMTGKIDKLLASKERGVAKLNAKNAKNAVRYARY